MPRIAVGNCGPLLDTSSHDRLPKIPPRAAPTPQLLQNLLSMILPRPGLSWGIKESTGYRKPCPSWWTQHLGVLPLGSSAPSRLSIVLSRAGAGGPPGPLEGPW